MNVNPTCPSRQHQRQSKSFISSKYRLAANIGSSISNRNGTTNNVLSQNNVSQIPRASRNSVERFTRAPAADEPYYALARIEDRMTHLNGLSNLINAMDEIMKPGR